MKTIKSFLSLRLANKLNRTSLYTSLGCFLFYLGTSVSSLRSLLIEAAIILLGREISFDFWSSFLETVGVYIFFIALLTFFSFVLNLGSHLPIWLSKVGSYLEHHPITKYLLIGVIWLILIAFFSRRNLTNANFWYDESVQFWISKGVNHFSKPFTGTGGLHDVIYLNIINNHDPGGFTLLLHFWSALSTNTLFLRSLPLLFFVLSVIVVSLISFIWFPKGAFSFFAGFILMLSSLLKNYAFELRPYSMELLAVIVGLLIIYNLPLILEQWKSSILAGFALAFLLTARYSVIVSVFSFGCVSLYFVFFQSRSPKYKKNLLLLFSPILLSSLLIYFFMLVKQPAGLNTPSYVAPYMLLTGDIKEILLNADAVLVYAPFLFLLLIFFIFDKSNTLSHLNLYIIYTIIINIAFAALSLFGIYPWSFITKWDISSHGILLLSILPIIHWIIQRLNGLVGDLQTTQFLFTICFLGLMLFLVIDFNYENLDSTYDNFRDCNVMDDKNALVGTYDYATPTLKLLFEFGPFQSYIDLYQNMAIEYYDDGDINQLDNFDYIIIPHWAPKSNEKYIAVSSSKNWKICSGRKYSQMYVNINR